MLLAYGEMSRVYRGLKPHNINGRLFITLQCHVVEEDGPNGRIYHQFWRTTDEPTLIPIWCICFYLRDKSEEPANKPRFKMKRNGGALYDIDLQRWDGDEDEFKNDMVLLKLFRDV